MADVIATVADVLDRLGRAPLDIANLGCVRSNLGSWRAHRHQDVPMVEAQFDGRLRGTMLVALNNIAVD